MIGRILIYGAALAVCTLLILAWTRGSQRRRFFKAYKTPNPDWQPEDAPFLRVVEDGFRLKRSTAHHLPSAATPMELYLTLYPEHCIYDACELEHFIIALNRLAPRLPEEPLTRSFRELADLVKTASAQPSN